MNADAWSPDQYERFGEERRQPFFDLLGLVHPWPAMRVVDLGCGTGELTRELHVRLQARETVGIDSSDAMLSKSKAFVRDGLRFQLGDIAAFSEAQSFDLVFSNAALHWVPDHEALLGRLTAALAEEGQLAVQVPANHDHPSHLVSEEVAGEPPFRDLLAGHVRKSPVLEPEAYAAVLHRLGYRQQHVRLQVYGHRLASREDVVEWVKGTLLTDYQKRLPADVFEAFLARYRERLLPRLEDTRPHFFAFKRILIWAER